MTQGRFEGLRRGAKVTWYDDQTRAWVRREVMTPWRKAGYPCGVVTLLPTVVYGSQDVTSPRELK